MESLSLTCSRYAFGDFESDIEQKKLRQANLIICTHMRIFVEVYYNAVASNLKKEAKEKGHLISFTLWRRRGLHRTTKRGKDKTILG